MNHASLFSGIGGFDLAAEWAGWNNLFHCEWNPFGQRVLKHHFPNSISYNDITKTDFTIHRGQIDILTGGFPCQPYSSAGKRLGKADERHLFPHMLRCIKEVKPRWIIGENVRGLVSWNGGMVFNEVCDDLEREGYEVQSFLIPAAGVNAPHQRYRIWFIAYNDSNYNGNGFNECNSQYEISTTNTGINAFCDINESNDNGITTNTSTWNTRKGCVSSQGGSKFSFERGKAEMSRVVSGQTFLSGIEKKKCNICGYIPKFDITNSDNFVCKCRNYSTEKRWQKQSIGTKSFSESTKWESFSIKSPICGGDDGLPRELDNITFSKWRQESIKAYGNAIVPQVAFEIFKTINIFEDKLKNL